MAHSADQLMPAAVLGMNAAPQDERQAAPARGGRRLSVVVICAAIVLSAVWIRLGIVGGEWWQIQWLEVSGSFQRVSPEMVRSVLAPALGRGYFSLDMQELSVAVASLPWVADIEIRRRWPDTLEVIVIEHQPVAYWRDASVISQRGEVFPLQVPVLIQGLPRLFGPEGQKDTVVTLWQEVQGRLDEVALIVSEFHVSDRGAVWLQLNNGMRVDLGREQLMHRTRRFVAAMPQLRTAQGELPLRVDMRYSNGFAVEWPEAAPAFELEQVPEHG